MKGLGGGQGCVCVCIFVCVRACVYVCMHASLGAPRVLTRQDPTQVVQTEE